MNSYAGPEKGVLREAETDRTAHSPAQTGTFSLRRAHYFTKPVKPLLTVEQQQALIELVREGDAAAKRKIIACNMHLVIDFAKRYANRGLEPLELVREGNHGLAQALEKFELEDDSGFPAYAALCIRQHIERAIMERSNSLRQRVSGLPVIPHDAPLPMPAILPNKPIAIGGYHGCFA